MFRMTITWAWSSSSALILLFSAAVTIITILLYVNSQNTLMARRSRKYRKEQKSNIPRGSSGWPLIGETLDFIASGYSSRPVSFMDKRKSLYGKVFRTHILGRPIVVSTDPEVNKIILQNHGNVFIPSYPKSITELFGKSSILQMNGILHKRMHSLVGGFLRSPQLKFRIARDVENSVKFSLANWKHKKQPIYIQDETKRITFEVLVKVLMSVAPGEDMDLLKIEFEEFIKGLICIPIKFPGTRLYKSLEAKRRLLSMVGKIIEERKSTMDDAGDDEEDSPNDVIDVLLRNTDELSFERTQHHHHQRLPLDFISGNIVEMMIPGEDSVPMAMTLAVKYLSDSSIALSRVVLQLGWIILNVVSDEGRFASSTKMLNFKRQRDTFKKLYAFLTREENMKLKRQKAESSDDYTWTDYMSLQFTQNVITETLRMANIINAVWRKAQKDVEIKGYLIPKDWCVVTSFTSVHMDEENYANPYQFDPWRWEKIGGSVNNNNTFTPFGGGQRLCPGLELSRLEISIFLHHFVTTYRWAAEADDIVTFPTVKMKRKLPITILPMV